MMSEKNGVILSNSRLNMVLFMMLLTFRTHSFIF